ncbi:pseudouridine synthase [Leptothermofonsia sp. ETS-13]|uniref:pseudouridine synthase n=1 Tax=Leptothermofonsia sp. ETS-13 TaxID=3035696 RepID=UPI003B9ED3F8
MSGIVSRDERVQKILSQWGIASRRQAEQMILEGRVRLNGTIAQLGQKADPAFDRIEVDGIALQPASRPKPIYLLLNKPLGVVSTCTDPWGRVTVLDLLPPEFHHQQGIHPVGRLDADSTGALLLTNDGDLTYFLTHPRHCIPKTYEVWVAGFPSETVLRRWRQGVGLDGRKTLPAQVEVLEQHPEDKTLLRIILREGRNRQIRRVAEQLGHPVIHLHRTAIGSIALQSPGSPPLPSGSCRPLKDIEIGFLKTQIDLLSERMPAKRSDAHE